MNKLSQDVVSKIEKGKISPKPRYLFLFRNTAMWLSAALVTIFGIFSVALISYNLSSQDWDIYSHLNQSFLGFVVSTLPYLWIVLTLIMLLIAIFNVEHSKKGYRYSPFWVAVISLGITIAFGLTVQAFGVGKALDNYLGQKFSNYRTVELQGERVWSQSAKGLFSGTIKSNENNVINLEGFDGDEWQVDYANATVRGNLKLSAGTKIKVIGQATGKLIMASEIRPWMGNGKGTGHRSQR